MPVNFVQINVVICPSLQDQPLNHYHLKRPVSTRYRLNPHSYFCILSTRSIRKFDFGIKINWHQFIVFISCKSLLVLTIVFIRKSTYCHVSFHKKFQFTVYRIAHFIYQAICYWAVWFKLPIVLIPTNNVWFWYQNKIGGFL